MTSPRQIARNISNWVKVSSRPVPFLIMASKRPNPGTIDTEGGPSRAKRVKVHSSGATAHKGTGHWSMKLVASMEDPKLVVKSDELTVTIKDAYPKAKHHYLVLPKENIPSLRSLKPSHLSLMKHILETGKALEEDLKANDLSLVFRHGYHASPSMSRLHMHVISQDFDSPCLKNKKHWNSFTSDFFRDAEDVISTLETKGRVDFGQSKFEEMLKLPLKCHVCHTPLQNIPKLKEHIRKHIK